MSNPLLPVPPTPNSAAANGASYVITGFLVIAAGLAAILIALQLALASPKLAASTDVAAVVGTVTGAVGSLCGAFFGIQMASRANTQISSEREGSNRNLESALRLLERQGSGPRPGQ